MKDADLCTVVLSRAKADELWSHLKLGIAQLITRERVRAQAQPGLARPFSLTALIDEPGPEH